MSDELTPMQRQYRAIKRDLPPGAILMFRLGDFYEMFGEDAVVASPILGATLTQRADQPMCGIPYHALDAYLAKLIRAGKTAALCDQMEDPRTVKKGAIVRREVTRIVTPGTVTEDGLLDADANCYIAAVSGLGLALLDLSTGEFAVEPFDSAEKLADALARYRPAELVLPRPDTEDADSRPDAADLQSAAKSAAKNTSYADAWTFSLDAAREELLRHFNVTSLDGFGLEGKCSTSTSPSATPSTTCAASACANRPTFSRSMPAPSATSRSCRATASPRRPPSSASSTSRARPWARAASPAGSASHSAAPTP